MNVFDLEILNLNLEKIGNFSFDGLITNSAINHYALKNSVVNYQASLRSGNHKTKDRGEVAYSTRKLYKQKGTGNARAGSAKSPIRRHGGTVFGPVVRDHGIKINRKEKKLALRSIIAHSLRNNNLKVFENFSLPDHKTKSLAGLIHKLELRECLIVDDACERNLILAAGNLQNVKVVTSDSLNVYDIMKFKNVIFSKLAIQKIESRLCK